MKSNPNPSFCPMLPYESLSSHASIDKKIKKRKYKKNNNQKINEKEKKRKINIDLAILPSHDNRTTSLKNIPVTLWVYNTKVQTEALVDLRATMNFADRVIMENNNLKTHKLANLYCVINVDRHSQQGGTNN